MRGSENGDCDKWGVPNELNRLIARCVFAGIRPGDNRAPPTGPEVVDALERFIAANPGNERGWTLRADLFTLCDDPVGTMYCCFRALEVNPLSCEAHAEVARIAQELERPPHEVRAHLEKVLANCRGHSDEESLLLSAMGVADVLGLTDLARSAAELGKLRFPETDWTPRGPGADRTALGETEKGDSEDTG